MSNGTEEKVLGTEEKVLGPGAVLHKVDAKGELIEESALGGIAEPADKQPVAPEVLPTPTPVTEPGEHAQEAQQ